MDLLGTLSGILLILLGFGLLIFIHELGHFLAAKWAGIRADGFAIGMGPAVLSWRRGVGLKTGSSNNWVKQQHGRFPIEMSDAELDELGYGETEYSLRALPIGGYVRMLGQDDTDPGAVSSDPRSYGRTAIGKRMVVVSAGVVMNAILAVVLFMVCFLGGVRFEAPVIGAVSPTLPAGSARAINADELGLSGDTAGILPGDRIVRIDGDSVETFPDVQIAIAMSRPGTPLDVEIERDGVDAPLRFTMTPVKNESMGLLSVGIAPAGSATLFSGGRNDAEVVTSLERLELGGSGLVPGAVLETVGGEAVNFWEDLDRAATGAAGGTIATTWRIGEGDAARTLDIDVPVDPTWQPMRAPDTPPSLEQGILGLVPLLRVAEVSADSHNAAVLRENDVILRVGEVDAPRLAQLRDAAGERAGRTIEMLLERDGAIESVTASVSADGLIGFLPGPAFDSPRLGATLPVYGAPDDGSGADDGVDAGDGWIERTGAFAGVMPLSRMRSVDGVEVADWSAFRAALREATADAFASGADDVVEFVVEPPIAGAIPESLTIAMTADDVRTLHELGWTPRLPEWLFEPVWTTLSADGNPIRAITMGFDRTHRVMLMTYLTIDRLFRGSVGVEQLRGPVGIVHLGTNVLDRGWMYLLFFLAIISVNLAVLNFLPLPIVDGGLFLYLVYEKIRGVPPSIGFQNAAAFVGLCLLGAIFVTTFYNDVLRLLG